MGKPVRIMFINRIVNTGIKPTTAINPITPPKKVLIGSEENIVEKKRFDTFFIRSNQPALNFDS
tara:strand:- start:86 stop:277 length:192 start_codon:yes stop_codon:yes gene_type:complete